MAKALKKSIQTFGFVGIICWGIFFGGLKCVKEKDEKTLLMKTKLTRKMKIFECKQKTNKEIVTEN